MNETASPVMSEEFHLDFLYGGSIRDDINHPHSVLLTPVFDDFDREHRKDPNHIVGVVIAVLPWDHYYENILPEEAHGIQVVMEDSCGDQFTYIVDGPVAEFLGYGVSTFACFG